MDITQANGGATLGASLRHRLNYLSDRQGVVAGNIANASTPNYLSKDLTFAGAVKKAKLTMATTNGAHLSPKHGPATGKIVEDTTHIRNDGNSVEVTEELQKLADIQLEHRMMTQLMAKYASFQRLGLGRNQ